MILYYVNIFFFTLLYEFLSFFIYMSISTEKSCTLPLGLATEQRDSILSASSSGRQDLGKRNRFSSK